MLTFTRFLIVAAIAAGSLPAFGQSVHFAGELEIPRIARFRKLPMRMMLEVSLREPQVTTELEPGLIEFFDNLLRSSSEIELKTEAARSLGRIARGKHGDISGSVDTLRTLLFHENSDLQRAAVGALVAANPTEAAGDLLELSETANDRLRTTFEPALARWGFEPAAEVWKERLDSNRSSSTSVSLAVNGLAQLRHTPAASSVQKLLQNPNASYQNRYDAARALCILAPRAARDAASDFKSSGLQDRLLALALLDNNEEPSISETTAFLSDNQNAVAAQAWDQLQKLKPEALREHVKAGHLHADSTVRFAAVRVMEQFPSSEYCDFLNDLLGDVHIGVRNLARAALLVYCDSGDELRKQVVSNAAIAVEKNDNWQRTEQSLLIAAILRETQFTKMCVPHLTHERGEVYVTSAWFMHLYPDPFVMNKVTAIAEARYEQRTQGEISNQLAFLFQAAGFLEHKPMQPLCERQFSKGSGLGEFGRAAGIWALGLMNRNDPASKLVPRLVDRLNDRDSMIPETDLIRRMSVMSLGRMGAKSEIGQIRNAYKVDAPESLIPESARWALRELGETDIPPSKTEADRTQPVGGWKVFPVKDKPKN